MILCRRQALHVHKFSYCLKVNPERPSKLPVSMQLSTKHFVSNQSLNTVIFGVVQSSEKVSYGKTTTKWLPKHHYNESLNFFIGNILIADKNNNRINMISEQGSFRSYAVTADDGLSSPRYLCMNEEGYLMVAEQSGSIKTFQYL